MTCLVLAPRREGDEELENSAWVAQKTVERVPGAVHLVGADVVRERFERALTPAIVGVAFFGHGEVDRLMGADRDPLVDQHNVALFRDRWLHAFACNAGTLLGKLAVAQGSSIFVGYERPLDVGWALPPSAEPEFVELVTCITVALIAGKRDEHDLRAIASRAADAFVLALEEVVDEDKSLGWISLHLLAQQLVDSMVVVLSPPP